MILFSYMGEIKTNTSVRANGTAKQLELIWDNGSLWTFISESAAKRINAPFFELCEPKTFHGLGNGKFRAHYATNIYIKLRGIWCSYLLYIVPDDAMPKMDILIGHEFMQSYNIRLDPRHRKLIIQKDDLLRASFVY